ncbi:NAD(P)/FAD-dependent oxidoreductase [Paucibacter sp. PLA-PC-4]|uniref:NAD(P)/FAD-dependent oxidoreductase n=1 Tax=Paucibacter sp. PLA-PC-4 TaxID=2993655 RepID=UPI002248E977|nr:NAD(P)/FAD-dependent oxidoreductase [Paucibacter sp. PLA-PC-4]MCX2862506.1 NAD(P)/FAD-dependent oxidoreductase [Paucibacter sp. PLA-PC-4]
MTFDALVIGGSFAGLSAAMQIARGRRRVCVVDAGAPRNRFASASHGFFGHDGEAPLAMIANAREKLLAYPNVHFIQGLAVGAAAEAGGGGFSVVLHTGEALRARKLVLACGIVDRLPEGIPGLQERWGRTVLHCPYCHGYEFDGRPLGVLWLGPMSGHQAQLIPEWGPTTLFLNGCEAELEGALRAQLLARGVALEPVPLAGMEDGGARLCDGRLIEIAALYLASRTEMASPLAAQLGCEFDAGPFGPVIRTDAFKQTTVVGVYAAGDAARVPHNATFASADGVMAGASVHQALVFGT